jgi:hypothetical protein
MFIIESSGSASANVSAAAAVNSGLKVVRESDTQVRLYGFVGVAGDVRLTVKPDAFRTMPSSLNTFATDTQVGFAEVSNTPQLIELTSGVAASGLTFTIKLVGDTFQDNTELVGGSGNVASYIKVGGSGLDEFGIVASGVITSSSGSLVVTILDIDAASGILMVSSGALVKNIAKEIDIVIPANALTLNGGAVTVLTGAKASTITTVPKLAIVLLEE